MKNIDDLQNFSDIIEYCIDHRIGLTETNRFGINPLMMAAIINDIELAQKLLSVSDENGTRLIDINAMNTHYETAAHLAYQSGKGDKFALLNLLIESGCDLSITSFPGSNLLTDPSEEERININIDFNKYQNCTFQQSLPRTIEGLTPQGMHEATVRQELPIQAELSAKAKEFYSSDEKALVEKLRETLHTSSGDKMQTDELGWSILLNAIWGRVIQKEKDKGITKEASKLTKLGYNYSGDLEQFNKIETVSDIIQYCINNDISLNDTNNYGTTPLMLAAISNNSTVVKKLLSAKDKEGNPLVDINACNSHYETAALLAYQEGAYETLKVLIEYGCDTSKEAFTGLCLENSDVINDLKKHGIEIKPREISEHKRENMPKTIGGMTPEAMKMYAKTGKDFPEKRLGVQKDLSSKVSQYLLLKNKLTTRFNPQNNATCTQKDYAGWTPLLNAILVDNIDKALERKKNRNKPNPILRNANSGRSY